jgi:hypothetical protein
MIFGLWRFLKNDGVLQTAPCFKDAFKVLILKGNYSYLKDTTSGGAEIGKLRKLLLVFSTGF